MCRPPIIQQVSFPFIYVIFYVVRRNHGRMLLRNHGRVHGVSLNLTPTVKANESRRPRILLRIKGKRYGGRRRKRKKARRLF